MTFAQDHPYSAPLYCASSDPLLLKPYRPRCVAPSASPTDSIDTTNHNRCMYNCSLNALAGFPFTDVNIANNHFNRWKACYFCVVPSVLVIGLAMPSAKLLAATAKLIETEAEEAEIGDDDSLFIGPPPPAVVKEVASANDAERFEEVTRIMGAEVDNPYDIVGVNRNMAADSIKKIQAVGVNILEYWKLSLMVHPDKCPHAEANQAFIKLSKVFKALQDPVKRKAMDDKIDEKEEKERFKSKAMREAAQWRRLQGVYTFNMLQPHFCEMMLSEVEDLEKWILETKLSTMRPNTTNKYSVVLDDFGMESMLEKFGGDVELGRYFNTRMSRGMRLLTAVDIDMVQEARKVHPDKNPPGDPKAAHNFKKFQKERETKLITILKNRLRPFVEGQTT
ncbi:hypothetical protein L2E82_01512 [Cichorium intybus]|uniref:Uncharacterized protein n=1 Tax=Cichorium intybus TaxID=13427 RepID=A0ACB9GYS8_CICIN|nr:hypothetical protein L2E82_01512 [Cichorium intybus]